MATTKATQPSQKTQNISSYVCRICDLNGHKMIDCPKFDEMQKIFHGKSIIVVKVQLVVETQTIIVDVNVVDVSITTRSKVIENTTRNFGFCNCLLQLKFCCMRHMQLQICVVA
jgi:hypothetical protein